MLRPSTTQPGNKFKIAAIAGALCFAATSAPVFASNAYRVDINGNAVINITDDSFNRLTLSPGANLNEIAYTLVDSSGTISDVLMDVTGNFLIRSFAGADTITVQNVEFPGSVRIVTGNAADDIELAGGSVAGGIQIISGAGSDNVVANGVTVNGRTRIVTASGNDQIAVHDHTARNIFIISSGSDADTVNVANLNVVGRTSILTGAGADQVKVEDATSNDRFVVIAGGEDDSVDLTGLLLSGRAVFTLGAGDDFLSIGDSTIDTTNPLFKGGIGEDTLEDRGTNDLTDVNPQYNTFEEIIDGNLTYAVGETGPGGGTVFQVDDTGRTGLEIWRSDITEGGLAAYGCHTVDIPRVNNVPGVNESTIEAQSGQEMTRELIREECLSETDAASLADAFMSPNGTADWYLPSATELLTAVRQLSRLHSPDALSNYWSASEQTDLNAFVVFETIRSIDGVSTVVGDAGSQSKLATTRVLPVRSF